MTHLIAAGPLLFEPGDRLSREEFLELWVLLGVYARRTGVCGAASNATWLMLDSAPQPDIAVRLLPQFGGGTTITEDGLASGSPELVAEIMRSTRSFDLGPKLDLYERAGVSEYIAVLTEVRRVEWRFLDAGRYRILQPDADGILRSRVFPGLWLDQDAFWRDDAERLLGVLEQGLASEECRMFLDRVRNIR